MILHIPSSSEMKTHTHFLYFPNTHAHLIAALAVARAESAAASTQSAADELFAHDSTCIHVYVYAREIHIRGFFLTILVVSDASFLW